jgi:ferredoxin
MALEKKRVILTFPSLLIEKPITYHLVKDYDFRVNILRAKILSGEEGRLLFEVEAEPEDLERGFEFLKSEGVSITPLSKEIQWNEDSCTHCGACTAVCGSGALSLDTGTWHLLFNVDKCVACEFCVNACPLGLFTVRF